MLHTTFHNKTNSTASYKKSVICCAIYFIHKLVHCVSHQNIQLNFFKFSFILVIRIPADAC